MVRRSGSRPMAACTINAKDAVTGRLPKQVYPYSSFAIYAPTKIS